MNNKEFNKKLSEILNDYVRKEYGEKGIDRFARNYIGIHSTKGLSTIKKMFNQGHSFSEEEVKNLSELFDMPTLIDEYYDSIICDIKSKKDGDNNIVSVNSMSNPANNKDIVRSENVLFAIEKYRFGEAKTPMLIFSDNHECIEYIISKAGIEAVILEYVPWEYRLIKETPHDVFVGTIKLSEYSSIDSISRPYQTYKGIIEKEVKKHFILIVECVDSCQRKLMFKSFCNEPHVISYNSEMQVERAVTEQKEHPEKGIGWGYGTLPSDRNATYIKSLFYVPHGEYLCVHEDYGITWNWGKAVAKSVDGVNDKSYRSFASLRKYEVEVTRYVESEDAPIFQDVDDDDRFGLDYELDSYKVLTNKVNSWYASEYERAYENTEKLVSKEFAPAIKASNHYKATSPLLEGRWYLPSLVELVVARKDIEPGLYWTSSKDGAENILYDSKNNKVVAPNGKPQKGWVMPFILEKSKY